MKVNLDELKVFVDNKEIDIVSSDIKFEFPKRKIDIIKIEKKNCINNNSIAEFFNINPVNLLSKIVSFKDGNKIEHRYEVIEIKEFIENESITFLATEIISEGQ